MKNILLIVLILSVQIVASSQNEAGKFVFDISQKGCNENNNKMAYWCDALGVSYLTGAGVKQNFNEAKKALNKSCNGNFSRGCYNLAHLYLKGEGVKQDNYKAVTIYKRACSLKNHRACYQLAWMTARGQGIRQDAAQAKEYFGKACDHGNNKGCKVYKVLNEKGL